MKELAAVFSAVVYDLVASPVQVFRAELNSFSQTSGKCELKGCCRDEYRAGITLLLASWKQSESGKLRAKVYLVGEDGMLWTLLQFVLRSRVERSESYVSNKSQRSFKHRLHGMPPSSGLIGPMPMVSAALQKHSCPPAVGTSGNGSGHLC